MEVIKTPVNIVYPIDGEKYPKANYGSSECEVESAYFAASFSVTCKGGSHSVEWGFDDDKIGEAHFYDEISVQLTWKLPKGKHKFWVQSDCGEAEVIFGIG
jgi:hypothetical protein